MEITEGIEYELNSRISEKAQKYLLIFPNEQIKRWAMRYLNTDNFIYITEREILNKGLVGLRYLGWDFANEETLFEIKKRRITNMELTEGLYVRTYYGISKIIRIIPQTCDMIFIGTDNKLGNVKYSEDELVGYYVDKTNYKGFITANSDVTKLLQVGDYVNGELVTQLMITTRDEQGVFGVPDKYNCFINEIHINTIVTKEQFKAMEYRVED